MSDLNTRINTPSSTPTSTPTNTPSHALGGTLNKFGENIESIAHVPEVRESVGERTPSPSGTGGSKTQTQKKTQKDLIVPEIKIIPPTESELKKELTQEIKRKISSLIREAKELEKRPGAFAFELQNSLKEIRKLSFQLSALMHMTLEKLKELYLTLFPNAVEKDKDK